MSASSRPPTLLDYLLELDFLPQNEGAWFDRATAGRIIRVVDLDGEETYLIALTLSGRLPLQGLLQPQHPARRDHRRDRSRVRPQPAAAGRAAMTIDELITLVEEARENLGGDAQIRIASQPGWPLRAALGCVTVPQSADPDDLYAADEHAAGQQNDGTFLWLATGDLPDGENPYAPRVGLERLIPPMTKTRPGPGHCERPGPGRRAPDPRLLVHSGDEEGGRRPS
jgi:hypothetical protein